jgi:hypothetical protein
MSQGSIRPIARQWENKILTAGLVTRRFGAFILGMPPCHTTPFIQPGIVIAPASVAEAQTCASSSLDCCDYCGSARLEWRKCKLICDDCKQINKSCADL